MCGSLDAVIRPQVDENACSCRKTPFVEDPSSLLPTPKRSPGSGEVSRFLNSAAHAQRTQVGAVDRLVDLASQVR